MCATEPTDRIVWLWTMEAQGRVGSDALRQLSRSVGSPVRQATLVDPDR